MKCILLQHHLSLRSVVSYVLMSNFPMIYHFKTITSFEFAFLMWFIYAPLQILVAKELLSLCELMMKVLSTGPRQTPGGYHSLLPPPEHRAEC